MLRISEVPPIAHPSAGVLLYLAGFDNGAAQLVELKRMPHPPGADEIEIDVYAAVCGPRQFTATTFSVS